MLVSDLWLLFELCRNACDRLGELLNWCYMRIVKHVCIILSAEMEDKRQNKYCKYSTMVLLLCHDMRIVTA